jgi:MoaA/NifB/PqqE/SkfB family radical SAM enzyme
MKIIDILSEWGVKSACYAGGGEPSLHPDFDKIIKYTHDKGLQVGISTNGTCLKPKDITAITNYCSYCGVSFDAGTEETWGKIKGSGLYNQLLKNCKALSDASKGNLDLTFKVVLSDDNQYEIYTACKLAKNLGFRNFFVRPVAFENIPGQEKNVNFDLDSINGQLALCLELETENFKVYGNFGRVDKAMHKIHNFTKCRASPLFIMFCADGWCYLCIDYRERPYGKMCKHEEIKDFWNSAEHKALINSIDLRNCPRCTFGHYNEQIEHYERDTFFRWFP